MPTTPFRDLLYRCALPVLAPSPRGQMSHRCDGQPLAAADDYERLLCRHHVLGASLLLKSGEQYARVDTSVQKPAHTAAGNSLYRVASVTKMATALVTLMLMDDGAFTLDTPAASLLPDARELPSLRDVTIRQLLSHMSGLCDTDEADQALREGRSFHDVLRADSIRFAAPGQSFRYCNFGFGLMGCILEQASGMTVDALFRQRLFEPLGMDAAMDASTLDEQRIMPISRILPYHAGQDVTIPPLGRVPMSAPDPVRHFGYTAGSLYTDTPSLSKLLDLIANDGAYAGRQLVSAPMIHEMTAQQATYGTLSPGMHYGLGLVLLQDRRLSDHTLFGHQGFAYGCANAAFFEEGTGHQVVFVNGGCSEARTGRLGLCNHDLLYWALRKELPQWK